MAIELPCMRNRSFLDPIATFQLTLRLNLVLGSAPPHFRFDSAISTEFTTRFLHRVFHFSRSIRMSALHGIS